MGMFGRAKSPQAVKTEPGSPRQLGTAVGLFALDMLTPDTHKTASVNEVWDAYRAWCRGGNSEPLAYTVFLMEFDRLAEEVGIRRLQSGANVVYPGVKIKRMKAA